MSILVQKMCRFFIKNGRKSITQTKLYSYLRLTTNKNSILFAKQNINNFIAPLKLKTIKRQKKSIQVIKSQTYHKAENSFILTLSKNLRQRVLKNFFFGLFKELESIHLQKSDILRKNMDDYIIGFTYKKSSKLKRSIFKSFKESVNVYGLFKSKRVWAIKDNFTEMQIIWKLKKKNIYSRKSFLRRIVNRDGIFSKNKIIINNNYLTSLRFGKKILKKKKNIIK